MSDSNSDSNSRDPLHNSYADEARERWGHTEAYRESQQRVKQMGPEGLAKVAKEGEDLIREIAAARHLGAKSPKVQALIARHYAHLRHFYEPSPEMYRGLGEMYASDPRFVAYYDRFAGETGEPGLAEFLREAIAEFCDRS